MSFPRRRESINLKERVATARLSVGATLCGRPNVRKNGFLLEFTPDLFLSITHKYQEAGIPLYFS